MSLGTTNPQVGQQYRILMWPSHKVCKVWIFLKRRAWITGQILGPFFSNNLEKFQYLEKTVIAGWESRIWPNPQNFPRRWACNLNTALLQFCHMQNIMRNIVKSKAITNCKTGLFRQRQIFLCVFNLPRNKATWCQWLLCRGYGKFMTQPLVHHTLACLLCMH